MGDCFCQRVILAHSDYRMHITKTQIARLMPGSPSRCFLQRSLGRDCVDKSALHKSAGAMMCLCKGLHGLHRLGEKDKMLCSVANIALIRIALSGGGYSMHRLAINIHQLGKID